MAPEPEQIPSRTCGCRDCLIDYPPERYGPRPAQHGCRGPWRVRYRDVDRKHRAKTLPTFSDACQFLVAVRLKAARHGA